MAGGLLSSARLADAEGTVGPHKNGEARALMVISPSQAVAIIRQRATTPEDRIPIVPQVVSLIPIFGGGSGPQFVQISLMV